MFDARAVLGIVLYFKEKVLKPLRKDGYLNRCNLSEKKMTNLRVGHFSFIRRRTRTNSRATVRGTVAATSSKTGGYHNFLRNTEKMQVESTICTTQQGGVFGLVWEFGW